MGYYTAARKKKKKRLFNDKDTQDTLLGEKKARCKLKGVQYANICAQKQEQE